MQSSLKQISECLHKVQDHRRQTMNSINDELITVLREYDGVNKEMVKLVDAREKLKAKQLIKQKTLEQIQSREPTNQAKIKHAKVDRDVITTEVDQSDRSLNDHMIRYQQAKLSDVKTIVRGYLLSQITFHVRALELLTEANEHVETICPERDISDLNGISNAALIGQNLAFTGQISGGMTAGQVPPNPQLLQTTSSNFFAQQAAIPATESGALYPGSSTLNGAQSWVAGPPSFQHAPTIVQQNPMIYPQHYSQHYGFSGASINGLDSSLRI